MPAFADLPLGTSHLLAIEVDAEVVSVEAFVAAVLASGVARQRPGDGDLMFPGSVFQVDQGGVTTVDEMLGGQQTTALQTGVNAGQSLGIAGRGRGGGHIC